MVTYLEPSGASAMKLFYRNYQCLKAIGYFRSRAPSRTFDRIFNTTLPNNLIITRRKSEGKLYTNGIKQGNLGLTLPPNFFDYSSTKHKSKKTKSWTNPTFSRVIPGTKRKSNFLGCVTVPFISIFSLLFVNKNLQWNHMVSYCKLSDQNFHILGNCMTKYAYCQECTFENFINVL